MQTFFRGQLNARMHQLISKAHGGVGLRHVTKPMVNELPFIVPPMAEQERYSDVVLSHQTSRTAMTTHLAHLATLFAALQSRAFAGEL